MRVLAALSGGVDSAVAAALAVEAGHEVTAVHMALSAEPQSCRLGARGCCSLEDSQDAARAAEIIGIPFYVWDLAEQFEQMVIDDFLSEYRAGHTPNPCVRCNEFVKFRELAERGRILGFDAVCTGHYARRIDGPEGPELHRGLDEAKDQSYVLAVMGKGELNRVILPLGDAPSKEWVRKQAELRGLGVSNKPDSYDICFIPDGDTAGFLRRHLGEKPGKIVDIDGQELGDHRGSYQFTIGQRKGLRLERPAEDGKPRYVLATDPKSNVVVVGAQELLSIDKITASDLVWYVNADDLGVEEVTAQIRAHGMPTVVSSVDVVESPEAIEGRELSVTLAEPIRGVALGQSLVLYHGSRVVAEGTITQTARKQSSAVPKIAVAR